MVRKLFLITLVGFIAVSIGTAWAGPQMNPGKWEISTETQMTGMNNMKILPQTHIQCMTEADIVPQSKEASKECQITDIQQKGDTVSWKIICSGQGGQMEGTGEITYQGDSMQGTMDMEITGAGMHIKNTLKGRRIGDCD